jgi:hypothetical protein
MTTLEEMRKLLSSPEFCKGESRFERIYFNHSPKQMRCLTPCKYSKYIKPISYPKVGSLWCKACSYNKGYDDKNNWVDCSYLRDHKNEVK